MNTAREILTTLGPWIYALLFGYCALKSGYLPVVAGYFAGTGDLDWRWTALTVFGGGYLGDEARYWLARQMSPWLRTREHLARPLSFAARLFAENGVWYCFTYRYAKGLRTVGSLPIGLAGWRWRRFAPINFASTAIWAAILVGGGYFAGESSIDLSEPYALWVAVTVMLAILAALFVAGRRLAKAPSEDSA